MAKILFLPLLQISSGHHQVAHSIMDELKMRDKQTTCEKVDILSYSYKFIEPIVSALYLKWIHYFPSVYHWIYQKSVYTKLDLVKTFRTYEVLFIPYMKRLLEEKQPDIIVCSHALPSYLVCKLKEEGYCTCKIVNIYTDYFIHHLWGIQEVDAHFISLNSMRYFLQKKGVNETKIYQTGIPIHPIYKEYVKRETDVPSNSITSVLVSGGSLGVGNIHKLLSNVPYDADIHFHVLCGKNTGLHDQLKKRSHPRITPYSYISSKESLNRLYNQVQAVLTKPGGVTLSECLHKRLPILVYGHLPGQEKINVDALVQEKLITLMNEADSYTQLEQQIKQIIHSTTLNTSYENYHNSLCSTSPADYILKSCM
ncbi:UDP-glucuronosyltransferase [Bacillus salitolerans]|uniref:UDP-glucuronosyltransferase n=1 Tax=Bacillus salitolerans TaxID=1437434 RepID=A0ABW4LTH3_9BACI